MNILIVDDRKENRYLLEVLLKGNEYHVVSAENGSEALEFLNSGHFDLVISDILMPVMDGFELCRKVKSSPELNTIPFIIYTATYTGQKDEVLANKMGADRFIQKPCEPDIFLKAVRELLDTYQHQDVTVSEIPIDNGEILKLYNERLVRKLEQKMIQLENEMVIRKKIEDTLRQSEEKYRSLYSSIRDAIFVCDINRTIIDCNPTFEELIGYSIHEIKGKKTSTIFAEKEEFIVWAEKLFTGNVITNALKTFNFRKKDSTIFPGELNIFSLISDEGTLSGFIGLIRDITEKRRAEKKQKDLESQLHQAQKMEAVGQLSGGIAHDFNNLLSIILGYSELLLEDLSNDHPHYEPLFEMHSAATKSKKLTRQLLIFSRKQVLDMKIQDVTQVVLGFKKLLQRVIGEDIKLMLTNYEEPLLVNADAAQLEQVLLNLAVNARDAMPGGGTLKIETTRMVLFEKDAPGEPGLSPGIYARISISDSGSGIRNEVMSHIFEPFFTTKSPEKGTGLGLATSYGIIKQHGGSIRVSSKLEFGTTFELYLPIWTNPDSSENPTNKNA